MSPLTAGTPVDGRPQELPLPRKIVLLIIFCLAMILDSFSGSALYAALPTLVVSMGMTESQSTWIMSAFQLTYASFMLISGRISDVYNPKSVFIVGVAGLGVISLGTGFVTDKILMIICRALAGITASMTIPSAMSLLINTFPDPLQQSRAIGLFGCCGGVAGIIGLLIGAVFIEWASYHWIFWSVAIVAVPAALACIFIIPPQISEVTNSVGAKCKSLDLVGVSIITSALVLFIFAVTSGSTDGWASAAVLAPLVISILMVIVFFYWEALLPQEKAAIPSRTWSYSNFSVLFVLALLPYFWWSTLFFIFTTLWQNVFHWSVISSALHMIPIAILCIAATFTGPLSRIYSPKWTILTGLSLCTVATVLLALGGGKPEYYWPYIFPAFTIGTTGAMLIYLHTSIAMFQATPSSMAGTVGAIFNGALQCGSAVGLSAVTSIETSVEATHGGSQQYTGRAAVFWFLLGIVALEFISVSVFFNRNTDRKPPLEPMREEPIDLTHCGMV